ncbi:MAG: hypothetical protein Q4C34_01925 [Bacteroidales bacterium]|nr:hypothetical protein [Bacteroidales bacterium]
MNFKAIFSIRPFVSVYLLAFALCVLSACSNDEPKPGPEPDSPKTGDVAFTVDIPGGSGAGTVSSPLAVTPDEPLALTVSQKSTYNDPDGSVISREPEATIAVKVMHDTVHARTLDELRQPGDASDVSTGRNGTMPVRHTIGQKIAVGGQEISLDMAYDVFTITNSVGDKVEMPYIRPNAARTGTAGAVEQRSGSRASVAVADVSVRPVAPRSRAITVTDSAMYEVNVRFNITLESVNAIKSETRTLDFSASYIGVVETTTTLDDPVATLSYAWSVRGGTLSSASPFVQTPGQDMALELAQTSVYTDEYKNRYVSEPRAAVTVSAVRDTVWVSSAEELTRLTETSPDATGAADAAQIFAVGDKSITIGWSYEQAAAPDGLDVAMPYYSLSPVKLKDVTTRKLEDNGKSPAKMADVYEVTATFSQTATAEGTPGDHPAAFDVDYVVTYIAALELKLVDVKYNRRYEWYDAHDNLALRSCYIIERELIYSNGQTKTEEYRSGNYMFDVSLSTSNPFSSFDYLEQYISDDEVLTFKQYTIYGESATTAIRGAKTGVPDLNKLSPLLLREDGYIDTFGPNYWSEYKIFGTDIKFGNGDHHVDGWYVRYVPYYRAYGLEYSDYSGPRYHEIREYGLHHGFTDRFYYFSDTDTVIDFTDWHAKRSFKETVEDVQIPEGPARLYKVECNARYLGKDFYIATVDTVYQNK